MFLYCTSRNKSWPSNEPYGFIVSAVASMVCLYAQIGMDKYDSFPSLPNDKFPRNVVVGVFVRMSLPIIASIAGSIWPLVCLTISARSFTTFTFGSFVLVLVEVSPIRFCCSSPSSFPPLSTIPTPTLNVISFSFITRTKSLANSFSSSEPSPNASSAHGESNKISFAIFAVFPCIASILCARISHAIVNASKISPLCSHFLFSFVLFFVFVFTSSSSSSSNSRARSSTSFEYSIDEWTFNSPSTSTFA